MRCVFRAGVPNRKRKYRPVERSMISGTSPYSWRLSISSRSCFVMAETGCSLSSPMALTSPQDYPQWHNCYPAPFQIIAKSGPAAWQYGTGTAGAGTRGRCFAPRHRDRYNDRRIFASERPAEGKEADVLTRVKRLERGYEHHRHHLPALQKAL